MCDNKLPTIPAGLWTTKEGKFGEGLLVRQQFVLAVVSGLLAKT